MKPDTYMPIVIGDYLKDTMHLSDAAHGSYLLLLFHYWQRGPLPDDDDMLAAIARCDRIAWAKRRQTLAPFFQIENGQWKHGRVERELERARAKSLAAQQSARKRWQQDTDADAMRSHSDGNANAMPTQCSPSPSPLLNPETSSPTIPAPRVARLPATPLPDDWKADEGYARQLGLQQAEVDREVVKFRAYWTGGKGQGSRKTAKGWRQAWMNWIGKAVDRGFVGGDGPAPAASAAGQPAISDLEAQWTARLSRYRPGGFWPSHWGNRPEHGNREIPQAALTAWRARHNREV